MKIRKLELFRRTLRQLEREVEEQVKTGKSCCGISLAQCHVLMELGLLGKTTITNLSEMLKLDKSTLSRTIEGMVQLGIVERAIAAEDRRFMEVTLSDSGKKFYGTLNQTCNAFYQLVFSNIPKGRREQVIESMHLFTEAIAKAHESERAAAEEIAGSCQVPESKWTLSSRTGKKGEFKEKPREYGQYENKIKG